MKDKTNIETLGQYMGFLIKNGVINVIAYSFDMPERRFKVMSYIPTNY